MPVSVDWNYPAPVAEPDLKVFMQVPDYPASQLRKKIPVWNIAGKDGFEIRHGIASDQVIILRTCYVHPVTFNAVNLLFDHEFYSNETI